MLGKLFHRKPQPEVVAKDKKLEELERRQQQNERRLQMVEATGHVLRRRLKN